jgi:hypothetical protein
MSLRYVLIVELGYSALVSFDWLIFTELRPSALTQHLELKGGHMLEPKRGEHAFRMLGLRRLFEYLSSLVCSREIYIVASSHVLLVR